MNRPALAIFFYSILILVGGYIGYSSAGSMASLVMGSIFGLALAVCAWCMYLEIPHAFNISLGLTALLFVFFTYRFLMTIKFFPSGFMAIVSVAALVYLILVRNGTLPR